MTPTEKEELLNQLDKHFNNNNFDDVLTVWEACPHNAQLDDDLDFHIYIYVLGACYGTKLDDDAKKYIDIALDYILSNSFEDQSIKDYEEYLWDLKFLMGGARNGIYGATKEALYRFNRGCELTGQAKELLPLIRWDFSRKALNPFMWTGIVIFIPLIILEILATLDFIPDLPEHTLLNWLKYIFLLWANLYGFFPKLIQPYHDKLMLLWLKYIKKDGRKPIKEVDVNNP